jgi:N utilization substance protein A
MVVSELRGEKIDIIPYNEEPARFVAKALSPARVREVLVDDEEQQATVIVPDDQLSLAIGRDGQNARLAAKLTGWKVDIKSEQEFSEMEADLDIEEEGAPAADGRCSAVLSAGRRCPNASLPNSRFCGLPQHQALARFGTNQVTVLSPLSEDEIAVLANADAGDDELRPLVDRAAAAFQEPSEEPEAEEAPAAEESADEEDEAPAPEEALAEDAAVEAEEPVAEEPAVEEPIAEDAEIAEDPGTTEAVEQAAEEAPPPEEALAEDAAVEAEEPVAEGEQA